VRPLWLALHHHHREVVGSLPLVEDDELSYGAARSTPSDSSQAQASWPSPSSRTRWSATHSCVSSKVAVMAANTDAQRLYERRGARPAELVLYRFGAE
jgi:hypothetical protein